MARAFDDAASQCLSYAGAPVTAVPVTLACWLYLDDSITPTVFGLFNHTNQSGVHFDYLQLLIQSGTVGARAYSIAGGASALATTALGLNAWHHACGVFAANNDRRAYLDGANKGTNTTAITPAGLDRTGVGAHIKDEGNAFFFSGRIAFPAIWNAALTDDEAAMLADGAWPPLVRPNNLVAFWPLNGAAPEPDIVGGYDLTPVNSPTVTDNPPYVIPPPEPSPTTLGRLHIPIRRASIAIR